MVRLTVAKSGMQVGSPHLNTFAKVPDAGLLYRLCLPISQGPNGRVLGVFILFQPLEMVRVLAVFWTICKLWAFPYVVLSYAWVSPCTNQKITSKRGC